jgi:V-type H+-transporting ATPase subunit H
MSHTKTPDPTLDKEREDVLLFEAENASTAENILANNIQWDSFRNANIIQARELELIKRYDKQPISAKISLFEQHGEEYSRLLLKMAANIAKEETVQYVLTLIHEILTADESKASFFNSITEIPNYPLSPFLRILALTEDNAAYTISKASYILAILLIKMRNPEEGDVQQTISWVAKRLRSKTSYQDISSALKMLQTLMRRDEFRLVFYRENGLQCLNTILFSQTQYYQLIYQVTYCSWLLSFNHTVAANFSNNSSIIHSLVEILRTSGKEKVTRMTIATLRNVVDKSDSNNDQMIEKNLPREIEKLSARKWSDEDISADLEIIKEALENKVAELSSFEKYKQELFNGELEWSTVHKSEKFWRENSHRFEENNNRALSALVALLTSNASSTVLAVACHDIGELVRFHPRGRILIQNSGVKVQIMKLMAGHQDAEVQRQALLCLQKIMVHNFEYLSR